MGRVQARDKFQPREGAIYLLPLEDKSFAVGLIIRTTKKKGGMLTCFFTPPIKEASLEKALDVVASRNILDITSSGIQTITSGEWPIVGELPGFARGEWPVPIFRNYSGQYTAFDQDDYMKALYLVAQPAERTYRESTHGVESLRIYINQRLGLLPMPGKQS